MKIPKAKKFTIIKWRPVKERPEDGSYVLMQLADRDGVYMEYGSYEGGKFIFHYFDGTELLLAEEKVLGWSYLPCWFFEKP